MCDIRYVSDGARRKQGAGGGKLILDTTHPHTDTREDTVADRFLYSSAESGESLKSLDIRDWINIWLHTGWTRMDASERLIYDAKTTKNNGADTCGRWGIVGRFMVCTQLRPFRMCAYMNLLISLCIAFSARFRLVPYGAFNKFGWLLIIK